VNGSRYLLAGLVVFLGLSIGLKAQEALISATRISHTQDAGSLWRFYDKKKSFTAQVPVMGDDQSSGVLIATCDDERGHLAYLLRTGFIDRPPLDITMDIVLDGAKILSEDAIADVGGYSTDFINKRNFLRALQKLQGKTEFRMDIIGESSRLELTFTLASDLGFQRAVARCSQIME
jgi:hypothetical protein